MGMSRNSGYGKGSPRIKLAPVPFPTQNILGATDYDYDFGKIAYQENIEQVAFHAGSGNWIPLGGGSSYIKTINTISPTTAGNFTLTAGSGITLTPGTNAITIALSGGGQAIDTINSVAPAANGNFSLTSSSSSLTLSNIANGQNIEVTGGAAGAVLRGTGVSTPPGYSSTFFVDDASFQALLLGSVAGGAPQISLENSSSEANSYARYTIKTASATGDMYLNYDAPGGLGNDFQVGYQASTSSLVIQSNPASATGNMSGTTIQQMTLAGQQTLPLQPCFGAYLSASTTNDVTGDGTIYTVICDTEEYDQGGNYNNATGIFTAPVAGKYLFQFIADFANLAAGHNAGDIYLTLSGAGYQGASINLGAVRDANNNCALSVSHIISLAASDTVTFQVVAQGATKTVGVAGGADGSGRKITYVSGALIC